MTAAFLTSLSGRMRSWFRSAEERPIDVLPVRVGGPLYDRPTRTPASVLGLDQALIWVVIALLSWSLVMVYSASIAMPDNPRFGKIEPYHFLLRHTMSIGMAFVAALLAFQVPMNVWEKVARKLFVDFAGLLVEEMVVQFVGLITRSGEHLALVRVAHAVEVDFIVGVDELFVVGLAAAIPLARAGGGDEGVRPLAHPDLQTQRVAPRDTGGRMQHQGVTHLGAFRVERLLHPQRPLVAIVAQHAAGACAGEAQVQLGMPGRGGDGEAGRHGAGLWRKRRGRGIRNCAHLRGGRPGLRRRPGGGGRGSVRAAAWGWTGCCAARRGRCPAAGGGCAARR